MRRLLCLGVWCLAAFGLTQGTLKLAFPNAGHRAIWIGHDPTPKDAKESRDAGAELPAGEGNVWVWDKDSGRLASHPVATLKGQWTLTAKDFTLLAHAKLRIEHEGKPVASAQIELPGSSSLLSPSDKGEVDVYGIAPPAAKITVKYKTKSGDQGAISASFAFKLEDASKPLKWIVSIPEEVDTVAEGTASPSPPATAPQRSEPAAAEPKNPLGRLIILVIALLAGAGLVYAALRYLKSNQAGVAEKLRQLGVDVPKAPGDDPAPQPIQPIKPEPAQKILLGDADPAPITPITVAAATGIPRLIAANGDALEIPEGETLIGRELGLGMSLPNETTVSRRHASMNRTGTTVTVRDLGSSNGTFVSGSKITDEATLRPGEALQFGQAQFRFEA